MYGSNVVRTSSIRQNHAHFWIDQREDPRDASSDFDEAKRLDMDFGYPTIRPPEKKIVQTMNTFACRPGKGGIQANEMAIEMRSKLNQAN